MRKIKSVTYGSGEDATFFTLRSDVDVAKAKAKAGDVPGYMERMSQSIPPELHFIESGFEEGHHYVNGYDRDNDVIFTFVNCPVLLEYFRAEETHYAETAATEASNE